MYSIILFSQIDSHRKWLLPSKSIMNQVKILNSPEFSSSPPLHSVPFLQPVPQSILQSREHYQIFPSSDSMIYQMDLHPNDIIFDFYNYIVVIFKLEYWGNMQVMLWK